MVKIVIVRTRSAPRESAHVEETLTRLGIPKRFSFSVRDDSPSTMGMLMNVRHLVTWGPLSSALEKKLSSAKNGLHPPRGGFERKGVKMPFAKGGVFGSRGDAINELVERMLP